MAISMTCVTFDCEDAKRVAAFWAEALGWVLKGDRVVGPDGLFLEFIDVPEAKAVKNRVHLGLDAKPNLDIEIERLIALGATIAWEEEFPADWPLRNVVLRDVEGNEFCLGGDKMPGG